MVSSPARQFMRQMSCVVFLTVALLEQNNDAAGFRDNSKSSREVTLISHDNGRKRIGFRIIRRKGNFGIH